MDAVESQLKNMCWKQHRSAVEFKLLLIDSYYNVWYTCGVQIELMTGGSVFTIEWMILDHNSYSLLNRTIDLITNNIVWLN